MAQRLIAALEFTQSDMMRWWSAPHHAMQRRGFTPGRLDRYALVMSRILGSKYVTVLLMLAKCP